jgi:acyl-CoA thioesterase
MAALSKNDIARRCADILWASDHASRHLGIEVLSIAPGKATIAMTVAPTMINGHGTCHGGYIFMLADSAFGYACNTNDQRSVAQHCSVTYVSPAKLGMRLLAEAFERQRGERSGITDVTVRDEAGNIIAEFRGNSRTVPGTILPTG